jgi:hypothetical protein
MFITTAFNFTLGYAIMNVQEIQEGMELNGTHKLLIYRDVNLLGKNIITLNKNKEALIDASKEDGGSKHRENKVYVYILSPEFRAKSCLKDS